MAKLSKSEIEFYQANGYVVPDYKIPEPMLEQLRQALNETIANNPEVRPEQLASIHTAKAGPGDTKGHSTFLAVEQVGINLPGGEENLETSIDPLLGDAYGTLGEAPSYITLTVYYRVGGGISSKKNTPGL